MKFFLQHNYELSIFYLPFWMKMYFRLIENQNIIIPNSSIHKCNLQKSHGFQTLRQIIKTQRLVGEIIAHKAKSPLL